jgi:rhamnogalacturonan endolyase
MSGKHFSRAAALALLLTGLSPGHAFAAFGITSSGGNYIVDTGGGLVFRVNGSSCDINSLKLNGGAELQATSAGSHIASGLGTATVTTSLSPSGTSGLITCATSTLTHYLAVRRNENIIYMATYISAEPSVGELRWITRLNSTVLPNGPTPSTIRDNTGAIESSDVFGLSNGQTRSKYYGNDQARNLSVRGVTGSGVGVFMIYGNRESSSGGPFFRDIQTQLGGNTELYNYMNSGHNQTEPFRTNVLHGPYALVFTTGSTPIAPDMSWMSGLNLQGWVSGRGMITGTVSGVTSGIASYVGFANSTAQYWTVPSSSGAFTSPPMKPGSYTMTLYQGELAVGTRTVSVSSGGTTTGQNLASTWSTPSAIFRIGTWDGAPTGFKNFSNLTIMHPSDVRMSTWGVTNFVVGSSATADFPAYQWKDVNNSTTVHFNLTAGQVAAHTVRIGISAATAGGRPQISVNSWTSAAPSPSTQPSSRSLTIGTYRGNNALYTYSVPASAVVSGANVMTITTISGSSGTAFLSPGFSYDCVELY